MSHDLCMRSGNLVWCQVKRVGDVVVNDDICRFLKGRCSPAKHNLIHGQRDDPNCRGSSTHQIGAGRNLAKAWAI